MMPMQDCHHGTAALPGEFIALRRYDDLSPDDR